MKFLVFSLVSVAAAVLVGVTLSGRAPDGPADDYHAIFADASNLVAGDEVRVAGIRVGTVGELSITDDQPGPGHLLAQRTVAMTTGTHAAVKYKNLVGDRYLELTAGDGPALAPDGTIPVGQTAPALDLDALFNGFKPLLAALSPEQVNSVSGELVTVLQGEGGTIDELLAALASVTSTLADRDQVIGDLVTNLDAALAKVNTTELGQLVTQLQQLVGGLAGRDGWRGRALRRRPAARGGIGERRLGRAAVGRARSQAGRCGAEPDRRSAPRAGGGLGERRLGAAVVVRYRREAGRRRVCRLDHLQGGELDTRRGAARSRRRRPRTRRVALFLHRRQKATRGTAPPAIALLPSRS